MSHSQVQSLLDFTFQNSPASILRVSSDSSGVVLLVGNYPVKIIGLVDERKRIGIGQNHDSVRTARMYV
jgi:hypothetical protein